MTVTVNITFLSLPGYPNTLSGRAIILPERGFEDDLWEPPELIQAELWDDRTGEPFEGIPSDEAYRILLQTAESLAFCDAEEK